MKLNLPNKITLFRVFCVIGILVLSVVEYYLHIKENVLATFSLSTGTYTYIRVVILILFIVAAISDAIDGHIARKYNMITTFGKFLDPIADKLLVNETAIILAFFNELPIYVPLVYIFRDTIVDGLRFVAAKKNVVIAASKLGKIKTTTQMIGLIAYLVLGPISLTNSTLSWILFGIINVSVVFSLLSGIDYLRKNFKILSEE